MLESIRKVEAREPGATLRTGPVFIVGMPRSGTKLLRGLLNQSPHIAVPDIETDFFPFLVRWVQRNGQSRRLVDFQRLYAELIKTPYFAHRDSSRPFSLEGWLASCERFDAAGLFSGFVRAELGAQGGPGVRWGDKSPAYIRHVALLLAHFPDAQIIHLIRDVRDYCASVRRAWGKDVRRAAYRWGQDVASAHRACSSSPERCLQVRYEELLSSPRSQMQRICAFLETPFSEAMTRLGRSTEAVGDAAGRTEIVRTNFNKFDGKLTRREIRDIESLAFDTMLLLGIKPLYAVRQREMGSPERRARRLYDGMQLLLRSRGRFGFAGALRFHIAHRRVVE